MIMSTMIKEASIFIHVQLSDEGCRGIGNGRTILNPTNTADACAVSCYYLRERSPHRDKDTVHVYFFLRFQRFILRLIFTTENEVKMKAKI